MRRWGQARCIAPCSRWRRKPWWPSSAAARSCRAGSIPKLTRSSLHRYPGRHGISRLPRSNPADALRPALVRPENPDKPSKPGKFAETAIGYVHIDVSELRLAQGKLNTRRRACYAWPSTGSRSSPDGRVPRRCRQDERGQLPARRGQGAWHHACHAYAIHTVLTDNSMAPVGP